MIMKSFNAAAIPQNFFPTLANSIKKYNLVTILLISPRASSKATLLIQLLSFSVLRYKLMTWLGIFVLVPALKSVCLCRVHTSRVQSKLHDRSTLVRFLSSLSYYSFIPNSIQFSTNWLKTLKCWDFRLNLSFLFF